MKQLLITGASGFVGQQLCHYLSKLGIAYTTFSGDVTKPATFNQGTFDTIIHLAALIPHKDSWTDEQLYNVNVQGTKNLFDHYPHAKMVLISTKDVLHRPLTDYAKSKLEAEKIVIQKKTNLIIRLPSIFGPDQKQDKLIPCLFRHYYRGKLCIIHNNDLREYLFVGEAAKQIYGQLGESGVVTFKGIRVRNRRLDQIIESIHKKKRLDLIEQEKKLKKQLVICSQSYQID